MGGRGQVPWESGVRPLPWGLPGQSAEDLLAEVLWVEGRPLPGRLACLESTCHVSPSLARPLLHSQAGPGPRRGGAGMLALSPISPTLELHWAAPPLMGWPGGVLAGGLGCS